jgi:hypothetical protein
MTEMPETTVVGQQAEVSTRPDRVDYGTGFAHYAARLASLVRSALCLSFRKAP